jgi:hypothetical protein
MQAILEDARGVHDVASHPNAIKCTFDADGLEQVARRGDSLAHLRYRRLDVGHRARVVRTRRDRRRLRKIVAMLVGYCGEWTRFNEGLNVFEAALSCINRVHDSRKMGKKKEKRVRWFCISTLDRTRGWVS